MECAKGHLSRAWGATRMGRGAALCHGHGHGHGFGLCSCSYVQLCMR